MADVGETDPILEEGTEDIEMEGGDDEVAGDALADIEPELAARPNHRLRQHAFGEPLHTPWPDG